MVPQHLLMMITLMAPCFAGQPPNQRSQRLDDWKQTKSYTHMVPFLKRKHLKDKSTNSAWKKMLCCFWWWCSLSYVHKKIDIYISYRYIHSLYHCIPLTPLTHDLMSEFSSLQPKRPWKNPVKQLVFPWVPETIDADGETHHQWSDVLFFILEGFFI